MIKPGANAAFVCRMEDVIDLYHEPYDPQRPVVCFESNKALHKQVRDPLPARRGAVAWYDYTYERNGTRNLFMLSKPLTGWRHIEVTQYTTFFPLCEQFLESHPPQAKN